MTAIVLLLILPLVVATLLVGGGVLAVLSWRPSWCAPVAGAFAAMTLMASAIGLILTVALNPVEVCTVPGTYSVGDQHRSPTGGPAEPLGSKCTSSLGR